MKKCTNCGTHCPDQAHQCGHCRMKGRFRPLPDEPSPSLGPDQKAPPTGRCKNCGENLPSLLPACPCCHMPLALRPTMENTPIARSAKVDWCGLAHQPCSSPFQN